VRAPEVPPLIGSSQTQPRGDLKRKRGQATVELALIVTLLVLLLVGVADVARIYGEQLAVVHAAGVGARWAALTPTQQARSGYADVCDAVRDDLRDDLASGKTLTIVAVQQSGNRVKVTVTYPHDFLFGLFQPGGMFVTLPSSYTTSATMPHIENLLPATYNGSCVMP
jgi:hypothetical protein